MAKTTLPPHLLARVINDTRAPPAATERSVPQSSAKKRTRNTAPTNALTQAVQQLLTLEGCMIWRHNAAAVYDPALGCYRAGSTRKGLPDTLGFYRHTGHIVCVEVKYGADTLKPDQREFLEQVRAAGGFACEGRSLEQVRKEFNEWKSSITKTTDGTSRSKNT